MPKIGTNRTFGTRNRETFEAKHFFQSLAKEFPRPGERAIDEAKRFLLRELASNPRPSIRPSNHDGKGSEAPAILFRRTIDSGREQGHTEAAIVGAFIEFNEKGLWLDGSRFEQAVDDNASDFEKLFDGPSWQVERRIYWDRRVFEAVSREFEQRAKPAPYEFILPIDHLSDAIKLTIVTLQQLADFESDSARRSLWYSMRDLDRLFNPARLPLADIRREEMNPEPIETTSNQFAHSAIERLRARFVLLADSTGWQSAIGGDWSGEAMPLASDAPDKIKRLLPLIEKASEQFEQAIKTPGLVYLEPKTIEPGDGKSPENRQLIDHNKQESIDLTYQQTECPIRLQGLDKPPIINGKEKSYRLNKWQYRVIDILRGAYPDNVEFAVLIHKCKSPMGKLPAVKDPVKCLKTLARSKKNDFGKILYFPKGNRDGYGIKS